MNRRTFLAHATALGLLADGRPAAVAASGAVQGGGVARDQSPGTAGPIEDDLAVVNAENASHGFGLAPDMAEALFAAGADAITLGNHAWDQKEALVFIDRAPRLIRPLNYPPGTPGRGAPAVVP